MIDVISLNDRYYVSIVDFIEHLKDCSESVLAFTGTEAPVTSKIVSDTLLATVDTLEGFMNDEVRVV